MPSCGDCGKGFGSGGCAGIHTDRWEGQCQQTFLYNCGGCTEKFNTSNRRKSHMNNQHTGAQCFPCGKKFYDQQRLDQHLKDAPAHGNPDESHGKPCGPTHAACKAEKPSIGNQAVCEGKKPFDANHAARLFHDKHARSPNWPDDKRRNTYIKVASTLAKALKVDGKISRQEYVGSEHERTSVKNSSDYDALFVARDKGVTSHNVASDPGYAQLMKDGEPLSASKAKNAMKGDVQKIINKTDFGEVTVKLRDHGPALQIDAFGKANGKLLCSVDVVPAIELPDRTMFVAKSPKFSSTDSTSQQNQNLWFKSYSLAAKEKLLCSDRGNYCRKETYRTSKVIRDREPNLKHITSYQLKSELFNVMDERRNDGDWSRNKLADRTVDVLQNVAKSYEKRSLPNYYEPEINLLHSTDEDTCRNTANRLNYLTKRPEKLFAMD